MKKILLYTFLAIVFFAIAGFAYAYKQLKQNIQIPPLSEITTVDDIVQPYLANKMTKGLSIGIYKNGKTKATGTYLEGDNEHGELKLFDENGELTKKMNCNRGACRTTWTKEANEQRI